jgi:hypothetical protein
MTEPIIESHADSVVTITRPMLACLIFGALLAGANIGYWGRTSASAHRVAWLEDEERRNLKMLGQVTSQRDGLQDIVAIYRDSAESAWRAAESSKQAARRATDVASFALKELNATHESTGEKFRRAISEFPTVRFSEPAPCEPLPWTADIDHACVQPVPFSTPTTRQDGMVPIQVLP